MTRLIAVLLALTFASPAFAQGTGNGANPALANPAALNEQAPAAYKVKFDTSKGTFVVDVHRDWAPTVSTTWSRMASTTMRASSA